MELNKTTFGRPNIHSSSNCKGLSKVRGSMTLFV